jgi:hypothetical protein
MSSKKQVKVGKYSREWAILPECDGDSQEVSGVESDSQETRKRYERKSDVIHQNGEIQTKL